MKCVELVACLILACSLLASCQRDSKEKTYTGFWKGECSDAFGLRIMPYDKSHYSVSFCGPGGCFEVGEWTPNTTIEGDPKYRVISKSVIEVQRTDGDWQRYQKCTTETHPTLDYSTMKGRKSDSRIVHFEPYKGLPDYEESPPFVVEDATEHARLGKALAGARASSKECVVGPVPVPLLEEFPLHSNICQKPTFASIKSAVKALAPGLDEKKLTFWKIDIDGDAEPELIVGYVDIGEGKHFKYPYLSLWLLRRVQGRYEATYAGPFLSGVLHAVRFFGMDRKNKIVFVRHQSCIECEPWLYLTAVDFLRPPSGAFFEFTYAKDHRDFSPRIEYVLPGMGHSMDADVETRIPKGSTGPHLMQHFLLKDGEPEWWIFSCRRELKCDYELHLGSLPSRYEATWAEAERL